MTIPDNQQTYSNMVAQNSESTLENLNDFDAVALRAIRLVERKVKTKSRITQN